MFELNHPLSIQVEVTEACNHRCVHCYNYWMEEGNKPRKMSADSAERIGEKILTEVKPFIVTITGGEPLTAEKASVVLLKELVRKGLSVSINTNLTLLDSETLERIIECAGTSQWGILTSLPETTPERYARITGRDNSKIFFKNLDNLVSTESIPVTVNMVVNSLNQDRVYAVGKQLYEQHGIRNFAATPILLPPYKLDPALCLTREATIRALEDLLKLNEDFGLEVECLEAIPKCLLPESLRYHHTNVFHRACSAGRATLAIGVEGEIRSCTHSAFSAGNILKEPFPEIWGKFKDIRNNQYVPDDCNGCLELNHCYGGCRVYAYNLSGHLKARDPRMVRPITETPSFEDDIPIRPDENGKYNFNYNTLWRKEKEGLYTLFSGRQQDVLFVNESFLELIKVLKEKGTITIGEFASSEPEQTRNMLGLLIQKNYLLPAESS